MHRNFQTYCVKVGSVIIGGDAPVVVQSMTDTNTENVQETVSQIKLLVDAGSEIVRITVNTEAAASAIPEICNRLENYGYKVPLVGDFHYNGHILLKKFHKSAQSLAKYRINPGNVGFGNKKDERFNTMLDVAIEYDKPIRIGVNWGSLDKAMATEMMDKNARSKNPKSSQEILLETLVLSALTSAESAIKRGIKEDKIILSCKVSQVEGLIKVYQMLAKRCNYALHLGLTEAGMGSKGIVSSSVAMGLLLNQGIGNTIRTSLTPEPKGNREQEVIVSQQILQSLGIRNFSPEVTACPGCGRTSSNFFRVLTEEVDQFLRKKMITWRHHLVGVEHLKVVVMGCVVNGPGESKHANIGISLPGNGENPSAPVFIDGEKVATLQGNSMVQEYKNIIETYVYKKYTRKSNVITLQ